MNSSILKSLNKLGPIYHTYFGFMPDEDNENIITHISYDEEDDVEIVYKLNDVIQESLTTVPYETVVITYNDSSYWRRKPSYEWYNSPSKWWKEGEYLKYLSKYKLPYLNTRPYICVNIPYEKITISASDKGSVITIDDILFATRGLACDDTRSYDKFTILSSNDEKLVLIPDMDNWST